MQSTINLLRSSGEPLSGGRPVTTRRHMCYFANMYGIPDGFDITIGQRLQPLDANSPDEYLCDAPAE